MHEDLGITALAQTLQTYGAWGVVAVQMFALGYVFRRFERRIERNDTDRKIQLKSTIQLVEEMTQATVQHTYAVQKVVDALVALERRLESVEKSGGLSE